ncbi:tyrosine-type recombinase/integrase [Changchengzhania lutea]|uniref:tyrosine-type recombinase/integrase n=1 Tax=Changchengzhania lutea TaxID=2049305 RepID=UPI00115F193B|nr:tyrosine-type recombinase/integrase [Changchengzhania lutea]
MNKKSKSTLEKLEKKLRFRNYSEQTIKTYLSYSEKFLISFNKDVYHISVKEAENYLESYPYTSISQQNQIISSVKFLYINVVGRKLNTLNIVRPRKEKKLPKIIDAELLAEKINKINNLKHKAILSLGLSCGLRISEVINLKWEHLDRKRNTLTVINGKGRKDRTTILNDNMIDLLTEYWKQYKPKDYVFNGQFKNKYSQSSIQRIVKKHIHQKASFHFLRHSFATYALDNGTELAPLSKSMGHQNTKTTEIYYHVSNNSLKTIRQAI